MTSGLDHQTLAAPINLRLRVAKEGDGLRRLEIEKQYPNVTFVHRHLDPNHIHEEPGEVTGGDGGKRIRKKILYANLFGKVVLTVPKGRTLAAMRNTKYYHSLYLGGYLIILTEEKLPWRRWQAVSGEIMKAQKDELTWHANVTAGPAVDPSNGSVG